MERFKVVERETKTKAYSKEGMCTYLPPLCLISIFSLPSLSYSFILPPLYSISLFIFFPFPLLYLSSHLPIFISLLFLPPLPSFPFCCTSPLLCIYLLLHPHPLSSTHTSYIHPHSVYLYLPLLYTYVYLSFPMLIY